MRSNWRTTYVCTYKRSSRCVVTFFSGRPGSAECLLVRWTCRKASPSPSVTTVTAWHRRHPRIWDYGGTPFSIGTSNINFSASTASTLPLLYVMGKQCATRYEFSSAKMIFLQCYWFYWVIDSAQTNYAVMKAPCDWWKWDNFPAATCSLAKSDHV